MRRATRTKGLQRRQATGHVEYGIPRRGRGRGWGQGPGQERRLQRTLNSLRRSASLYILLSSTSAMMAFLYTAWSASRWVSTYLVVGGGEGRGEEVAYQTVGLDVPKGGYT